MKNIIKEQIVQMLNIINEQSETINRYQNKISQIDLDIMLSNIRQLYEKYYELNKINNCETPVLNKNIKIEEQVAFYKHTKKETVRIDNNKIKKEKISHITKTIIADKFKDKKESINEKIAQTKTDKSIGSKMQHNHITDLKAVIGINEKFLFIKELFNGNMQEYNKTVNKLNDCKSHKETNNHINTLIKKYKWNNESEPVKRFNELLKRKFD